MKLALLGADDRTEPLSQAAVALGHEIVWAWGDERDYEAIRLIAPRLVCAADWENALLADVADAVIVPEFRGDATGALGEQAGADSQTADLRVEQLRRLVQENVPVLLAHPAHPSMLLYYELDMIRRDTGCPVLPWIVTRFDPAARRLVEAIRAGELGKVEQAVLTRETSARRRESILARFASDVDLLREVCGDLKRLSAMGPPHGGSDYASLGVQLSSANGVSARWTLAPAQGADGVKLTVIGSEAARELVLGGPIEAQSDAAATLYRESIRALEAAVARRPVVPDLLDAARAMELADSIDRSLRRGRVVDLHYEEFSESSTFKGHMTALGCGILMVSLLLLCIAAIAGRFKVGWLQFGAMALILVMGLVFLGMQFFGLAAAEKPK